MNNNTATPKEFIEIFNDTQNWITSNPDIYFNRPFGNVNILKQEE